MMNKKIGFIGLGAMGSKIAGRLISAGGYDLGLFNRTPEKAAVLVSGGSWQAESPKQLAERCNVIITVVTDGPAVREMVMGEAGAFAGAKPGTVFIDCSTIDVKTTRDLAEEAERLGCHWLDAPVLGSPKSAQDGEMPFVVGGLKEVLEEVKPILEVVGKKIVWMGESGLGQAAKLVHNITCGISLVAYSEALILGEKLGLSKKQTLEVLLNGAVVSPLLTMKAPKFEQNQFEPTMAPLVNMRKDLTLADDAAKTLHLNLPSLAVAKQMYDLAKENGLGRQDTSSVIKAMETLEIKDNKDKQSIIY